MCGLKWAAKSFWASTSTTISRRARCGANSSARASRRCSPPGKNLQGDISNKVYTAQHVFVTTDDVSDPAVRIRASRIRMVPGQYIEAWNAVLFMDGVPAFYYPYYKRNLGPHANNLNFSPATAAPTGRILLAHLHLVAERRGGRRVARGLPRAARPRRRAGCEPAPRPLGRRRVQVLLPARPGIPTRAWTQTAFHSLSGPIPENRQRLYFGWQATPATNLNVKALVNYQTDPLVLHDFFEGDYTANPQPNTFVEVNKYSAQLEPRRPDDAAREQFLRPGRAAAGREAHRLAAAGVRHAGFLRERKLRRLLPPDAGRDQLRCSPARTGPAPIMPRARADTFQQLLLPETFFGWLNVTPRAGGRLTYYGDETGPGGTNSETYRQGFQHRHGRVLQILAALDRRDEFAAGHGRPAPHRRAVGELRVCAAARARCRRNCRSSIPHRPARCCCPSNCPITTTLIRLTARTSSASACATRSRPSAPANSRICSTGMCCSTGGCIPTASQQHVQRPLFRPRVPPALVAHPESQTRYDINNGHLNLAYHQITFMPNEWWSWSLGHMYSRNGFVDSGDNPISSTMFLPGERQLGLPRAARFQRHGRPVAGPILHRLSRLAELDGRADLPRDGQRHGPEDFTVAFSFSIKAHPRHRLGGDTVEPYHLVGE